MENILHLRSFGARIRVKDGIFEVTVPDLTGAGNDRVEQFAPQQVQTILLHPHTSISSNVFLLAQEHRVQILILDHKDFPQIFAAGLSEPVSVQIWKAQLGLHGTLRGLDFARNWLCAKIQRKLEWFARMKNYRTGADLDILALAEAALRDALARMKHLRLVNVEENAKTLRGLEGSSSKRYYDTLSALLPEHLKFEGRSRRPAQDVFNALVNYGYGILYRWTEKALWEAGLNPYIGFMHNTDRSGKSLLYDFSESYKPWMDNAAFNLCAAKEAGAQHVMQKDDGVWLNKQGRELTAKAAYKRFNDKKIDVNGRKWSLLQSIDLDARRLAALLRGMEKEPANQVAA